MLLWFLVITAGSACGIVLGGLALLVIWVNLERVVMAGALLLGVVGLYLFFFTPWLRWVDHAIGLP